MTDGLVVDKVTPVADLFLVVIGLLQDRILEELVVFKLEKELEARLLGVEVFQTDVGEVFECLESGENIKSIRNGNEQAMVRLPHTHLLVLLRDLIADDRVVLERSQPELRNTLPFLLIDLGNLRARFLLVIILFFIVGISGFSGGDLLVSRLDLAGDDFGSARVQRSVAFSELWEGEWRVGRAQSLAMPDKVRPSTIHYSPSSPTPRSPTETRSRSWRAPAGCPSSPRYGA